MLGVCGIDVVLYINQNHYMFIWYNLRAVIDNIVEFISAMDFTRDSNKKMTYESLCWLKKLKDG
jgi:hypothetical protein